MSADLESAIERVAAHTIRRDMAAEDWEKAVALNGLLATDVEEYVDAAIDLVDRSIETQTSAGQFSYGSLDYKQWLQQSHLDSMKGISDPAAIGQSVLDVYWLTGDDGYLDAARRQYEFLADVDRTAEGGITHRRDAVELWVDSVYMLCPFLARYGRAADEPAAFDQAVTQIRAAAKRLQDPHSGLFRHIWQETPDAFPQSTFWARGNGWAAAGILDTLEYLPDDHPGREDLHDVFDDLVEGLPDLQDRSGFWHHILDDPESPLEASGTLMFSYAFKRGVEGGLLGDDYERAAERGLDVCLGCIDDDGGVTRVARPPGGPDMPFGVTSFGQGWFLLAATQFR